MGEERGGAWQLAVAILIDTFDCLTAREWREWVEWMIK